jgi:DNA-binding CsgD family transcriptional regulator
MDKKLDFRPTPAQVRVLRAIVEHETIKQTAAYLGLSRHTVDRHLDDLRDATGLRSLHLIIHRAVVEHWIDE